MKTTTGRARRHLTDRFSLCLAPGTKRTALALLGLGPTGLVTVRRAAVRSALDPSYALDAAAQMYRTARQEAPVAVIICQPPGPAETALHDGIRRRIGPFADITTVQADPQHRPGTWGTAVRGAACGLGYTLDRIPDAVLHLARECELRATGTD